MLAYQYFVVLCAWCYSLFEGCAGSVATVSLSSEITVYLPTGFHRSARKEDIFKFKAYHLEKTAQVLRDCSVKVNKK